MLRSMFAGLSGLVNHKTGLDVIGNNIANVNTIGFKTSRVTFQDLLSQTLTGASSPVDGGMGGTNGMQVGLGSKLGSIDVSMAQGNLQSTGNFTDLAVEGNGFFIFGEGDSGNYRYSRAGNFSIDAQGNLVHISGLHVMGWNVNDALTEINTSQNISDVTIPSGITIKAKQTDAIKYGYNLNASSYVQGEAQLQAGNSAGMGNVEGNWTGQVNGVATTYDTVGTHTIAITPQKVVGERTGLAGESPLISHKYQKISELIIMESNRISGSTPTIGGDNGDGTYTLKVIVDGVSNDIIVAGTDTVETVLENINRTIPGVTATLAQGNLSIKRNTAGVSKTVAVNDTVSASAATYGIADLLFSKTPANAGGVNFDTTSVIPASITWGFIPSTGSSGSFSNDTTHLSFSSGDSGIIGMNGIIVSSGQEGFSEGVAVVKTLSPEIHSTTARVYDSLGAPRNVILTFERTNANTWGWSATGNQVSGTGELTFNQYGQLLSTTNDKINIGGINGSQSATIKLDFGDITQFASDSSVISTSQDGYTKGNLDSYTIDQMGIIVGRFSNGLSRSLAQIAIANFNNPSGLQKMADSSFGETNNSGDPQIGMATLGGRGKVSTGTLEMSNVDIATEFANMIIYQRGFQANAKTISTADDLLNTLVNIKR
ncbi:MAG: hypothetical protein DKM50_10085 [Candidatus Margulisiibacteriota bacterium]|nr:MAG: hypothetical protein A2X43_04170 [Candidatus Margulisbacteria bacterium GWD2_39_127]OGI05196.1 MAG: hypothetical protein A2X42_02680 [Candidatus Margulisbacteria bacterium GWF2_38_17]OGI06245.1 MAG: hypothetical protein A2X41_08260 [Candidatus Margulisbacteria bacterium GWE2_39_32]PZM78901.1 MAG: hypothetical protein DKM50_10085 [Candidatus Margulisiibacteriota bacterium]HAR64516.1 hypothetical protein [Candidatus Margulisiibacteriota bacterium]